MLIVCLGLLGGAVIGAVCGFSIGLLVDSALLQTLGVSSLVLLAVGYLAGATGRRSRSRARSCRRRSRRR